MTARHFTPFSLNLRGKLVEFSRQQVMGIINVTPDSFYSGSRTQSHDDIALKAKKMLDEGADWLDLGAYSTCPGADDVTPAEEIERLRTGMRAIRSVAPDAIVSIDTFRADVALQAVEELGADMINDISGGLLDDDMPSTIAKLKVPYVLMHTRGTPATMQQLTDYRDVTGDVLAELARRIDIFGMAGVNDIIVDPGFGFAKTVEQNYRLLRDLEAFHVFERPLLVGVSRKSMIYRTFGTTPDEALNGTTVINTIALMAGASVLRVHDAKEAAEAVKIVELTYNDKTWLHLE